jgi:hypothetical protein
MENICISLVTTLLFGVITVSYGMEQFGTVLITNRHPHDLYVTTFLGRNFVVKSGRTEGFISGPAETNDESKDFHYAFEVAPTEMTFEVVQGTEAEKGSLLLPKQGALAETIAIFDKEVSLRCTMFSLFFHLYQKNNI